MRVLGRRGDRPPQLRIKNYCFLSSLPSLLFPVSMPSNYRLPPFSPSPQKPPPPQLARRSTVDHNDTPDWRGGLRRGSRDLLQFSTLTHDEENVWAVRADSA